jgi:hypothetical protein
MSQTEATMISQCLYSGIWSFLVVFLVMSLFVALSIYKEE